VLLEGTRFVRKLWKRPELAVLNPAETAPGIEVQSDEDLIAGIRTKTTPTFWHPSGTCAMGRGNGYT